MASNITPNLLFETIGNHLSARDDLWHVLNGPKRETWFNAETIAALSHKSPTSLSSGFRVYGEESCRALSEILSEFGQAAATAETDGWGRIPDVTILENCGNSAPVILTIIEAKLICPASTKKDDDVELTNDVDSQLQALGNTEKVDGLLDQLDRAKRLFPAAQVFGSVFAVHRLGQCEHVIASSFFDSLTRHINTLFAQTQWCLWDDEVKAFAGCQQVTPLGGMFNGQASIGLGILNSRTTGSSVRGVIDGK